MRILLDTHAFLWSVMDDSKLSDRARSIFLDADNELLISAVIGFEIAIKYTLGKLELAEPPRDFIENRIRNNALTQLPISLSHTYRLSHLPLHHRDPFDRMLIAQCQIEDLTLVTHDTKLSLYDIPLLEV